MKNIIVKTLLICALAFSGLMLSSYRYQDRDLGFALELPEGWELGEAPNENTAVLLSPLEGEGDAFRENMNVIVTKLDADISLSDLFNLNVENAKMMLPGFEAIEVEAVDVAALPAMKLIYSFTVEGTTLKNIVYILLDGRTMYTITFSCLEARFDEFRPVFEMIGSSFQLP
jgi:hypothetical protein